MKYALIILLSFLSACAPSITWVGNPVFEDVHSAPCVELGYRDDGIVVWRNCRVYVHLKQ